MLKADVLVTEHIATKGLPSATLELIVPDACQNLWLLSERWLSEVGFSHSILRNLDLKLS